MTEHAYEPARQRAPYMCLCGNAYRTREEVRAHVQHPEPEPEPPRLFPVYVAPAEEDAWDYYRGRRNAA